MRTSPLYNKRARARVLCTAISIAQIKIKQEEKVVEKFLRSRSVCVSVSHPTLSWGRPARIRDLYFGENNSLKLFGGERGGSTLAEVYS